jgi:catechol 2,3-dioxygenase-like lactoylglutathione lyase family enzyme
VKKLISILSLAMLCSSAESWAQLRSPNEAGVALGHWHTIVRDLDATKKFWTILGGTPMKIDGVDVMKFPGVFIFMTPGSPSAGSRGSVVDHIGFGVLDPEASIAKWSAAGVKVGKVNKSPLNGNTVGNVYSPDDIEIEVTQENGKDPYPLLPPNISIESNHMHIYVPVAIRQEMRDWYVKMFGAIPGELGANLIGNIPGVIFIRWTAHAEPSAPTKGRALDHIGFEVKGLDAFCKNLQAKGVKFDQPFSKSRHKSFASAEFTDPWGVSIELTEGLSRF